MSYILDALQKSQQEHDGDAVPTLSTEQPAEPRQPALFNPAVITALALGSVAVILAIFAIFSDALFTPEKEPAVVQTPTVTAPAQRTEDLPALPPEKDAATAELTTQAPAAKPLGEETATTEAPSAPATAQPEQESAAEMRGRDISPSIVDTSGTEQTAKPLPVSEFRQELLDIKQRLEKKSEADAAVVTPTSALDAEETPPEPVEESSPAEQIAPSRPGTARDLPYAVMNRLPKRKVSVHVFAQEPSERFIILNSRRRGEGETTREGLLIEEIFQDGVIFKFEDHRFFKPL